MNTTAMSSTSLFTEGRNCWSVAPARRVAFLIDADAYYQAFADAAEKAQRSILITAWDINGLIRLRRDRPRENLRQFFFRLLDAKPELQIYILSWDFPLIYAEDRELFPWFDKVWHTHPRLHFLWDDGHPFTACHHQKVVVIDDQLAFSGGLDLTDERWDTPGHRGVDRRRRGLHAPTYKPFHDATILIEGAAAGDLGELCRERWRRAGGEFSQTPDGLPRDLWPESVTPDLINMEVAISRTEPGFKGRPEVREVEQLFLDTIAAAERFIYLENQYFTSPTIADAIARRLQERGGPEIVVVMPQGCTGWLEEVTVGVLRERVVKRLLARDPFGRLHFYYPAIEGLPPGMYIKVHSKVMIVDDELVRIGSANLCSRSMGVDTECDVSIEALGDPSITRAIAGMRERLLSEHLGCAPAEIAAAFVETGSLVATIQRCGHSARCLIRFAGEVSPFWQRWVPEGLPVDPNRPFTRPRWISGFANRVTSLKTRLGIAHEPETYKSGHL
jgi:phospholipase D1/2